MLPAQSSLRRRGFQATVGNEARLDACDGGTLTAGPCLRVWSCNGHDLGATCFRTAEGAESAICECSIDGRIVDRVPYEAELCNEADVRAACRFREF